MPTVACSGGPRQALRKKVLAKQAPPLSQVTEEDVERQGLEEALGSSAVTTGGWGFSVPHRAWHMQELHAHVP